MLPWPLITCAAATGVPATFRPRCRRAASCPAAASRPVPAATVTGASSGTEPSNSLQNLTSNAFELERALCCYAPAGLFLRPSTPSPPFRSRVRVAERQETTCSSTRTTQSEEPTQRQRPLVLPRPRAAAHSAVCAWACCLAFERPENRASRAMATAADVGQGRLRDMQDVCDLCGDVYDGSAEVRPGGEAGRMRCIAMHRDASQWPRSARPLAGRASSVASCSLQLPDA